MSIQTATLAAKNDASSNAAATVTLAAVTGSQYVIHQILGGYDADPTGGSLTSTGIEDAQLSIPITKGGPIPHLLMPIRGAMSGAVAFTLAAGGASVTGTIQVLYTIHKVS